MTPAPLLLADSHAHLDRYDDAHLAAMLARAAASGVALILAVGVDAATSQRCTELARRPSVPAILAAVGLHPNRLASQTQLRRSPVGGWAGTAVEQEIEAIEALLAHPRVGAVGEIGLDTASAAPLDQQEAAFHRQLHLARQHNLAVLLHVVGAHERALAIVQQHGWGERCVAHYFVSDWPLAQRYLAAGCSLSLAKPLTHPAEHPHLPDVARRTPLDRLLLETDTYPLPGRTTEPADVRLVATAVAQARGITLEAVAQATWANLERVLGSRQY